MSAPENAIATTTEILPTAEERRFDLEQREAKAFTSSSLLPKEYQNNIPNCLIILNLARRTGADPFMLAQNIDVIHGRPSYRAAFMIACINISGRFSPLQYRIEGEGMARSCIAHARELESGDVIEGPPVTLQMAKDEGWSTKTGSKWKTMPDLMLRYRSAAFFARTICPELTMGLRTAEESEDIHATSRPALAAESVQAANDALDAARDVTPTEVDDEPEIDPHTGEVIPNDVGVLPL